MLPLFGRGKREEEQRDELLSAYLDGMLSERERERLEARLSEDPALRAELRAMHHTVSLLHELPQVAAPRNFILSESMVREESPEREARQARRQPQRAARAWAAPLLTAATTVVSLLFIVVLAGDLLLPNLGGLASAPAPMQQQEEAPKMALEAAPTGQVEMERQDAGDRASPPSTSSKAMGEEALEQPEAAAEEEETDIAATRAAEAPPGTGATRPPAGGGGSEEGIPLVQPTVPLTVTPVTILTPTIPAEAPVVSEDELGLLEPTPGALEVTPRVIGDETERERLELSPLVWRVLEVVLGLASLALGFATVRAWRRRQ